MSRAKPHSFENLSLLENLAIKWRYTDRPTFRPSAPQAYQCLISHFLASLGACNLILYIHVLINWHLPKQWIRWPISPDRIAGSGSDPLGLSFYKVIRWQVATFRMIAGSSSILLKCSWNKLCLWAVLLKFWFRTDLGPENSPGFYMFLTFLTIVTRWSLSTSNFYALIGQNFTGEFMRKIYAASGNLFTDSWSWQSFVSPCGVFNCLFLLDVRNEIQLLSRFFCNSWLVCLLRFWLRNTLLVKLIGNPISDSIVFKNELTHFPLFET